MHIVLDANILIADFRLKGSKFRILLDSLDKIGNVLCIPEVAFDETVYKFKKHLEDANRKMSNGIADVSHLLGRELSVPLLKSEDIEIETKEYREWLEIELGSYHAKILPYPKVKHKNVVARLLANKRPFKENELGYRDYLIWETVLEFSGSCDDNISFVSNNTKDFLDEQGTGLHSHLVEDLDEHGILKNRLTYYTSTL